MAPNHAHATRPRAHFVQLRLDRTPPVVADEVGVPRSAVRRKLLDRRGRRAEPGPPQLLKEHLRRGRETRRALDAMEPRDLADGFERRLAVDLGVDRGGDGVGPERYGAVVTGSERRRRK